MVSTPTFEIDEEFVKSAVPPRKRDSHKGMNGVVCVVGGSRTYHGAPFLCAMGAARTGVDLVYLAVPSMVATPVRSLSPDLIVFPLPDSKLTRGNANRLASWIPELDSIGIGPGLGPQNPNELKGALAALAGRCRTLVVDADALRPPILELPEGERAKMIVTPHAREFERLFGLKLPDALDERVPLVKEAAGDHGVVVLLKGPTDVVSDGARVGLNVTHSPAMTVGGTGDVLTGVTSGLAAKGLGRLEAACCAAYVNGLAGAEAARELGLHIVASDVVACIPKAMKRFDRLE
ncbi:MAG TPA: NAD(P)H-hydrate dehydratase [Nitrososphaerales archaeon]|nr:NAD(P)H-hydrate dehydratase [Nitrososphaerales archaeon]